HASPTTPSAAASGATDTPGHCLGHNGARPRVGLRGWDAGVRFGAVSELRILVVATQIKIPGVGGGQTHVSELLAHLREHGEVLALTRRGSSGPGVLDAGRYKGNGLPPKGLRHAVSALNYAGSLQAVRDFAPNVIYERGSSFGLGTFLSR